MIATTGMTGNELVDQISKISISGNVIPEPWYRTIVKSTGKPNLSAIIILADIVYWYRAKEVRDSETGKFIGYEKKFKGDLLQRSYQQLAEKFGMSKKQVTCAVIDLEELSLIERIFRTVQYGEIPMSNVLYIKINPKKVLEITFPDNETLSPKKGRPSPPKKGDPLPQKGDTLSPKKETPSLPKRRHPLSQKGDTYTENTTKTTTESNISSSSSTLEFEKIKGQINYTKIISEDGEIKPILDDIVSLIMDILNSSESTMVINKADVPVKKIKEELRALNEERVLSVIDALRCNVEADIRISNLRGWLLTSLYNAAANCSYMTLKSNKSKKGNTNKFNNFNQRKYDYEELERKLLEKNNNIRAVR